MVEDRERRQRAKKRVYKEHLGRYPQLLSNVGPLLSSCRRFHCLQPHVFCETISAKRLLKEDYCWTLFKVTRQRRPRLLKRSIEKGGTTGEGISTQFFGTSSIPGAFARRRSGGAGVIGWAANGLHQKPLLRKSPPTSRRLGSLVNVALVFSSDRSRKEEQPKRGSRHSSSGLRRFLGVRSCHRVGSERPAPEATSPKMKPTTRRLGRVDGSCGFICVLLFFRQTGADGILLVTRQRRPRHLKRSIEKGGTTEEGISTQFFGTSSIPGAFARRRSGGAGVIGWAANGLHQKPLLRKSPPTSRRLWSLVNVALVFSSDRSRKEEQPKRGSRHRCHRVGSERPAPEATSPKMKPTTRRLGQTGADGILLVTRQRRPRLLQRSIEEGGTTGEGISTQFFGTSSIPGAFARRRSGGAVVIGWAANGLHQKPLLRKKVLPLHVVYVFQANMSGWHSSGDKNRLLKNLTDVSIHRSLVNVALVFSSDRSRKEEQPERGSRHRCHRVGSERPAPEATSPKMKPTTRRLGIQANRSGWHSSGDKNRLLKNLTDVSIHRSLVNVALVFSSDRSRKEEQQERGSRHSSSGTSSIPGAFARRRSGGAVVIGWAANGLHQKPLLRKKVLPLHVVYGELMEVTRQRRPRLLQRSIEEGGTTGEGISTQFFGTSSIPGAFARRRSGGAGVIGWAANGLHQKPLLRKSPPTSRRLWSLVNVALVFSSDRSRKEEQPERGSRHRCHRVGSERPAPEATSPKMKPTTRRLGQTGADGILLVTRQRRPRLLQRSIEEGGTTGEGISTQFFGTSSIPGAFARRRSGGAGVIGWAANGLHQKPLLRKKVLPLHVVYGKHERMAFFWSLVNVALVFSSDRSRKEEQPERGSRHSSSGTSSIPGAFARRRSGGAGVIGWAANGLHQKPLLRKKVLPLHVVYGKHERMAFFWSLVNVAPRLLQRSIEEGGTTGEGISTQFFGTASIPVAFARKRSGGAGVIGWAANGLHQKPLLRKSPPTSRRLGQTGADGILLVTRQRRPRLLKRSIEEGGTTEEGISTQFFGTSSIPGAFARKRSGGAGVIGWAANGLHQKPLLRKSPPTSRRLGQTGADGILLVTRQRRPRLLQRSIEEGGTTGEGISTQFFGTASIPGAFARRRSGGAGVIGWAANGLHQKPLLRKSPPTSRRLGQTGADGILLVTRQRRPRLLQRSIEEGGTTEEGISTQFFGTSSIPGAFARRRSGGAGVIGWAANGLHQKPLLRKSPPTSRRLGQTGADGILLVIKSRPAKILTDAFFHRSLVNVAPRLLKRSIEEGGTTEEGISTQFFGTSSIPGAFARKRSGGAGVIGWAANGLHQKPLLRKSPPTSRRLGSLVNVALVFSSDRSRKEEQPERGSRHRYRKPSEFRITWSFQFFGTASIPGAFARRRSGGAGVIGWAANGLHQKPLLRKKVLPLHVVYGSLVNVALVFSSDRSRKEEQPERGSRHRYRKTLRIQNNVVLSVLRDCVDSWGVRSCHRVGSERPAPEATSPKKSPPTSRRLGQTGADGILLVTRQRRPRLLQRSIEEGGTTGEGISTQFFGTASIPGAFARRRSGGAGVIGWAANGLHQKPLLRKSPPTSRRLGQTGADGILLVTRQRRPRLLQRSIEEGGTTGEGISTQFFGTASIPGAFARRRSGGAGVIGWAANGLHQKPLLRKSPPTSRRLWQTGADGILLVTRQRRPRLLQRSIEEGGTTGEGISTQFFGTASIPGAFARRRSGGAGVIGWAANGLHQKPLLRKSPPTSRRLCIQANRSGWHSSGDKNRLLKNLTDVSIHRSLVNVALVFSSDRSRKEEQPERGSRHSSSGLRRFLGRSLVGEAVVQVTRQRRPRLLQRSIEEGGTTGEGISTQFFGTASIPGAFARRRSGGAGVIGWAANGLHQKPLLRKKVLPLHVTRQRRPRLLQRSIEEGGTTGEGISTQFFGTASIPGAFARRRSGGAGVIGWAANGLHQKPLLRKKVLPLHVVYVFRQTGADGILLVTRQRRPRLLQRSIEEGGTTGEGISTQFFGTSSIPGAFARRRSGGAGVIGWAANGLHQKPLLRKSPPTSRRLWSLVNVAPRLLQRSIEEGGTTGEGISTQFFGTASIPGAFARRRSGGAGVIGWAANGLHQKPLLRKSPPTSRRLGQTGADGILLVTRQRRPRLLQRSIEEGGTTGEGISTQFFGTASIPGAFARRRSGGAGVIGWAANGLHQKPLLRKSPPTSRRLGSLVNVAPRLLQRSIEEGGTTGEGISTQFFGTASIPVAFARRRSGGVIGWAANGLHQKPLLRKSPPTSRRLGQTGADGILLVTRQRRPRLLQRSIEEGGTTGEGISTQFFGTSSIPGAFARRRSGGAGVIGWAANGLHQKPLLRKKVLPLHVGYGELMEVTRQRRPRLLQRSIEEGGTTGEGISTQFFGTSSIPGAFARRRSGGAGVIGWAANGLHQKPLLRKKVLPLHVVYGELMEVLDLSVFFSFSGKQERMAFFWSLVNVALVFSSDRSRKEEQPKRGSRHRYQKPSEFRITWSFQFFGTSSIPGAFARKRSGGAGVIGWAVNGLHQKPFLRKSPPTSRRLGSLVNVALVFSSDRSRKEEQPERGSRHRCHRVGSERPAPEATSPKKSSHFTSSMVTRQRRPRLLQRSIEEGGTTGEGISTQFFGTASIPGAFARRRSGGAGVIGWAANGLHQKPLLRKSPPTSRRLGSLVNVALVFSSDRSRKEEQPERDLDTVLRDCVDSWGVRSCHRVGSERPAPEATSPKKSSHFTSSMYSGKQERMAFFWSLVNVALVFSSDRSRKEEQPERDLDTVLRDCVDSWGVRSCHRVGSERPAPEATSPKKSSHFTSSMANRSGWHSSSDKNRLLKNLTDVSIHRSLVNVALVFSSDRSRKEEQPERGSRHRCHRVGSERPAPEATSPKKSPPTSRRLGSLVNVAPRLLQRSIEEGGTTGEGISTQFFGTASIPGAFARRRSGGAGVIGWAANGLHQKPLLRKSPPTSRRLWQTGADGILLVTRQRRPRLLKRSIEEGGTTEEGISTQFFGTSSIPGAFARRRSGGAGVIGWAATGLHQKPLLRKSPPTSRRLWSLVNVALVFSSDRSRKEEQPERGSRHRCHRVGSERPAPEATSPKKSSHFTSSMVTRQRRPRLLQRSIEEGGTTGEGISTQFFGTSSIPGAFARRRSGGAGVIGWAANGLHQKPLLRKSPPTSRRLWQTGADGILLVTRQRRPRLLKRSIEEGGTTEEGISTQFFGTSSIPGAFARVIGWAANGLHQKPLLRKSPPTSRRLGSLVNVALVFSSDRSRKEEQPRGDLDTGIEKPSEFRITWSFQFFGTASIPGAFARRRSGGAGVIGVGSERPAPEATSPKKSSHFTSSMANRSGWHSSGDKNRLLKNLTDVSIHRSLVNVALVISSDRSRKEEQPERGSPHRCHRVGSERPAPVATSPKKSSHFTSSMVTRQRRPRLLQRSIEEGGTTEEGISTQFFGTSSIPGAFARRRSGGAGVIGWAANGLHQKPLLRKSPPTSRRLWQTGADGILLVTRQRRPRLLQRSIEEGGTTGEGISTQFFGTASIPGAFARRRSGGAGAKGWAANGLHQKPLLRKSPPTSRRLGQTGAEGILLVIKSRPAKILTDAFFHRSLVNVALIFSSDRSRKEEQPKRGSRHSSSGTSSIPGAFARRRSGGAGVIGWAANGLDQKPLLRKSPPTSRRLWSLVNVALVFSSDRSRKEEQPRGDLDTGIEKPSEFRITWSFQFFGTASIPVAFARRRSGGAGAKGWAANGLHQKPLLRKSPPTSRRLGQTGADGILLVTRQRRPRLLQRSIEEGGTTGEGISTQFFGTASIPVAFARRRSGGAGAKGWAANGLHQKPLLRKSPPTSRRLGQTGAKGILLVTRQRRPHLLKRSIEEGGTTEEGISTQFFGTSSIPGAFARRRSGGAGVIGWAANGLHQKPLLRKSPPTSRRLGQTGADGILLVTRQRRPRLLERSIEEGGTTEEGISTQFIGTSSIPGAFARRRSGGAGVIGWAANGLHQKPLLRKSPPTSRRLGQTGADGILLVTRQRRPRLLQRSIEEGGTTGEGISTQFIGTSSIPGAFARRRSGGAGVIGWAANGLHQKPLLRKSPPTSRRLGQTGADGILLVTRQRRPRLLQRSIEEGGTTEEGISTQFIGTSSIPGAFARRRSGGAGVIGWAANGLHQKPLLRKSPPTSRRLGQTGADGILLVTRQRRPRLLERSIEEGGTTEEGISTQFIGTSSIPGAFARRRSGGAGVIGWAANGLHQKPLLRKSPPTSRRLGQTGADGILLVTRQRRPRLLQRSIEEGGTTGEGISTQFIGTSSIPGAFARRRSGGAGVIGWAANGLHQKPLLRKSPPTSRRLGQTGADGILLVTRQRRPRLLQRSIEEGGTTGEGISTQFFGTSSIPVAFARRRSGGAGVIGWVANGLHQSLVNVALVFSSDRSRKEEQPERGSRHRCHRVGSERPAPVATSPKKSSHFTSSRANRSERHSSGDKSRPAKILTDVFFHRSLVNVALIFSSDRSRKEGQPKRGSRHRCHRVGSERPAPVATSPKKSSHFTSSMVTRQRRPHLLKRSIEEGGTTEEGISTQFFGTASIPVAFARRRSGGAGAKGWAANGLHQKPLLRKSPPTSRRLGQTGAKGILLVIKAAL
ncbi:unnamed protein product [Caenorhabditis auriculariae]|uniref:Uncharacterized protein n=1 Tax=Caenorhabditis auriculariae TaxID=2777116 RepID=A0A8S1GW84_9PELO|nr:unnamed protein product [Caenorhabditis auriculariae]